MIHLEILGPVDQTTLPIALPLAAGEVRAGFPSPADDYLEQELELVAHLIQHPSATFYMRAKGASMVRDGIYHGDLLIVDRSLDPKDGDVLVISVDGELTCKRLGKIDARPHLLPANPSFQPIPLEVADCQVWGVVTHNVHALRRGVPR